ncbi:Iron-sulfur cluster repair protein YtfE [Planctomycetes bacterium MalM25]|nr:Iron-sulfur cluster repair protein YtfE [Planctomycetes bacterium MalM25]
MLTLDPNQTVGELVRQRPMRARVFEALKIDYCCGGKVSLARACEKRGIGVDDVLQRIDQADAATDQDESPDPDAMTLTELADHVEATHHAYLREELPRLDWMTEKVARVHSDKEPRLLQVREAFLSLRAELEPHMMKEEQILFPIVRQMESSGAASEHPCGSVANPIRQMEHEHDQAGGELAILREATDDFAPPEWACNTYRAMLASLEQLEADMHQHIHKENNVMFPKAIELESNA